MNVEIFKEQQDAIFKTDQCYNKLFRAYVKKNDSEMALQMLRMNGLIKSILRTTTLAVIETDKVLKDACAYLEENEKLVNMIMKDHENNLCEICEFCNLSENKTPCVCCRENGGDVDGFMLKVPEDEEEDNGL